MRLGLVSCIYNNEDLKPFKGVHNRKQHYVNSLKSISRWGYDIHLFCSPKEYDELIREYKGFPNVYLHSYDLDKFPRIERIDEIRESNYDYYTNDHWGSRCVEVMWGKFVFLQKVLDAQIYDKVYWIDAGVSYPGLFPDRMNPHSVEDRYANNILDYNFDYIFNRNSMFLENLSAIQGDRLFFMRTTKQQHDLPECLSKTSVKKDTSVVGSLFGGSVLPLQEFIDEFMKLADECLEYGTLYFEQQLMTELFYRDQTKYLSYHFANWGHENSHHRLKNHDCTYHDIFEIWGNGDDEQKYQRSVVNHTKKSSYSKIISFSLFGYNEKYIKGMEKNISDIKKHLPDWRVRIFYDSHDAKAQSLTRTNYSHVDFVDVRYTLNLDTIDKNKTFWRFIAFSEKDALVLSRDADSRITPREIEYIRRWEEKEYPEKLFIIRDHPWQTVLPAGLIGMNTSRIDIQEMYKTILKAIREKEDYYGNDQDLLEELFENNLSEDVYICAYDNNNFISYDDHPFIGAQIDENEKPICDKAIQLQTEMMRNRKKLPEKTDNITYNICTLALGEGYCIDARTMIDSALTHASPQVITVVTDKPEMFDDIKDQENINIAMFHDTDKVKTAQGRQFNYNLKALALLEDSKVNNDANYSIFVDADLQFLEKSGDRISKQLFVHPDSKQKVFGMRPAKLITNKLKLYESFYAFKIKDLPTTEFHDNAHCINEQYLIIDRSMPKYRFFINRWLDKGEHIRINQRSAFAEGLEVGASLMEAFMELDFSFSWNRTLKSHSRKTGKDFYYR